MNKAELFYAYTAKLSQDRNIFKETDHRRLVKSFDADAIVNEYSTAIDWHPEIYDWYTAVVFSDGSKTTFNYKGEPES